MPIQPTNDPRILAFRRLADSLGGVAEIAPDAAPLIRRISLDLFGAAFVSADGAEGRAAFDASTMTIEGKAVYLWRGQRL